MKYFSKTYFKLCQFFWGKSYFDFSFRNVELFKTKISNREAFLFGSFYSKNIDAFSDRQFHQAACTDF